MAEAVEAMGEIKPTSYRSLQRYRRIMDATNSPNKLKHYEYFSIVRTFFKVVAEELPKREGGVLIDNFAYIYNRVSTQRVVVPYKIARNYNFASTDYHRYFLFTRFVGGLDYWTLDSRSVNKLVTNSIVKRLKSGFGYKNYADTFFKMRKLTSRKLKKIT